MGCCVVAGTSAAILSTIAFTVIPQWFKAHEGLATGCVTLGSAVGGIFFSLVLQALFNKLVWSTASLVLAGINSGFLILGCMLVETNLPERTAANGELGRVLDMSRSLKFWLVVYVIFASEVVLYICWGSIPSIAVATKFGESQFYLMMAYNIGSIVGRTLPPFLSDRKFGPINTATIMTIFTLLTVLVIWLPFGTLDVAALYVVVALMGIGTGSFVPLGVSCVSALCEPGSTGTWLGSAYTIISIATLIANPVTAAIFGRYGSDALVAFLAAILSSGLISVIALRWVCHGQRWVFKSKI
ncbi:major facilitator superfamily domain-containing protein [Diplogelasinospora grovesii]|uniref:Major facilitator superfamily domain-containing protein n=1 Tax=Diplogelasinospora grovesii TaxID=303347 RepID=A0AAN6RZX8_9PEZI|nr:major facilitator superfamily domain-containing protein [Diplogelasinospora grovesii]